MNRIILFKHQLYHQKLALLLCLFIAASLQSCAQQKNTVARISNGLIKGVAENGILVFKGIPYAKAPIGDLRFKAPQMAANWKDTLSCEQFGPIASQHGNTANGLQGSEDCLSLNVYTPEVSANAKLPVVVWVHGGGMTGGNGKSQNGHAFSDQDSVVTVTINYRLGVFGFLYLGDKDQAYRTSGNDGLLDCIMALKWIRQNITQLGGDPDRVTVMGQSAGAKLISTLLLAPEARGYFKQLVLESGSVQCLRDTVTAKAIRQRLIDTLQASQGMAKLSGAGALLSLSTAELIAAQDKVLGGAQGTNYFGPVADGKVISGDPYTALQTTADPKIRLMMGTNTGESRMFMDADKRLYHPDAKVLSDWFGNNYKYVLSAYQQASQNKASDAVTMAVLTQYMYQMHAYRLMAALAANGNPLYTYRLSYSKDGKGANHAQELKYVWYLPALQQYDATEEKLAKEMHPLWVNFIKGKNPGTVAGNTWPRFENKKPVIMNFDRQTEVLVLKEIYNDKAHPSSGFILN